MFRRTLSGSSPIVTLLVAVNSVGVVAGDRYRTRVCVLRYFRKGMKGERTGWLLLGYRYCRTRWNTASRLDTKIWA
ncbi:hypothetical protein EDB87DRAFT_1619349 [Lactarius vividus]|nr:hypothetical protein EDB87DRAFT_1619349 [Lactarius vividus]